MGDPNNTDAMRMAVYHDPDEEYSYRSFALKESEDVANIRKSYRPFLMSEEIAASDWISKLELSTTLKMVDQLLQSGNDRLKVLVLYGSMRQR